MRDNLKALLKRLLDHFLLASVSFVGAKLAEVGSGLVVVKDGQAGLCEKSGPEYPLPAKHHSGTTKKKGRFPRPPPVKMVHSLVE
jgi:hypothetical protein